jgi:hypothetical protein
MMVSSFLTDSAALEASKVKSAKAARAGAKKATETPKKAPRRKSKTSPTLAEAPTPDATA